VKKGYIVAIVLSALLVMPVSGGRAESFLDEVTFGADAGLSMPMGNSGDLYSMGFVVGVNGFYPYRENILIGGRIAYNRWGIDSGGWVGSNVDGSSSVMEFVPQVRYLFPTEEGKTMSFFGQGGLGFYRYAFNVDVENDLPLVGLQKYSYDDSAVNLGLCFGGGALFEQGSGRVWEVRPMIHVVFTEGESTTFLSLTVGTTF
jgi:hypothetical protein